MITVPRVRNVAAAAVLVSASVTSGCAWQSYTATRAARHLTGNHTRLHAIVPITRALRPYTVVEVTPFDNLLPGRVPAHAEQYIDDQLLATLRSLTPAPRIVSTARPDEQAAAPDTPAAQTLRVEGFIDDFDGGSLPLRIAELGFNHVAVTIRIRLRDKASSEIVGAASVTAQDDRVTATTDGAIDQAVKKIHGFVQDGYAR